MLKKSQIVFAVILVVAAGGLFLFARHKNGGTSAAVPQAAMAAPGGSRTAPPPPLPSTVATGTPFAGSPYAAHAYLISATGTYDAATRQALSGFQVQRHMLANGSMSVQMVSLQGGYPSRTYTVAPGEKLYFVENFIMDDASGGDRFLGDDRVILVGANGMIQ